MTDTEHQAVAVALTLLADAIDDGNDHLFPELSATEIRALAGRTATPTPSEKGEKLCDG